jgi:hypothetical protein
MEKRRFDFERTRRHEALRATTSATFEKNTGLSHRFAVSAGTDSVEER